MIDAFAKFNENKSCGIGHFVLANPTSKIKIFEFVDLLIWEKRPCSDSYVPPLITQYGFLISMQGEDIFVGAIREVKEETGVSQFFLPDMEGSR